MHVFLWVDHMMQLFGMDLASVLTDTFPLTCFALMSPEWTMDSVVQLGVYT